MGMKPVRRNPFPVDGDKPFGPMGGTKMAQPSDTRHVVVYVTAPVAEAAPLASALLQQQLAACVNIVPAIRSLYRWEGELCDDQESLLIIKTRADLLDRLRQAVVDKHPYEVPEVIALPVVGGHGPYLAWIDQVTQSATD